MWSGQGPTQGTCRRAGSKADAQALRKAVWQFMGSHTRTCRCTGRPSAVKCVRAEEPRALEPARDTYSSFARDCPTPGAAHRSFSRSTDRGARPHNGLPLSGFLQRNGVHMAACVHLRGTVRSEGCQDQKATEQTSALHSILEKGSTQHKDTSGRGLQGAKHSERGHTGHKQNILKDGSTPQIVILTSKRSI